MACSKAVEAYFGFDMLHLWLFMVDDGFARRPDTTVTK